jgi:hypothetical protein
VGIVDHDLFVFPNNRYGVYWPASYAASRAIPGYNLLPQYTHDSSLAAPRVPMGVIAEQRARGYADARSNRGFRSQRKYERLTRQSFLRIGRAICSSDAIRTEWVC